MQKENEDIDPDDSSGDEQADVAKDRKVAKTTPRVCLFLFLGERRRRIFTHFILCRVCAYCARLRAAN
jgi:hypothetical protein